MLKEPTTPTTIETVFFDKKMSTLIADSPTEELLSSRDTLQVTRVVAGKWLFEKDEEKTNEEKMALRYLIDHSKEILTQALDIRDSLSETGRFELRIKRLEEKVSELENSLREVGVWISQFPAEIVRRRT